MAAAALMQKAASTLGLDNTEARSEGEAETEKQKEKEKAEGGTLVAGEYVEPEQVVMAPREEGVGAASEVLGAADFEMMRILGTGECSAEATDTWREEGMRLMRVL